MRKNYRECQIFYLCPKCSFFTTINIIWQCNVVPPPEEELHVIPDMSQQYITKFHQYQLPLVYIQ